MTTLAALFGALPLMFSSGSGAELRQPLGLVMVGGLLVSQVLTLFTTPVIYLFFDRLGRRWSTDAAQPTAGRQGRHDEPDARTADRSRSRSLVMSLSSPFIKRPVATTLLNLSVVLAGAVAFTLLPVSPLPQIDFPVIFVSANLPGASPETMASTVATPLERALGTIAGVNELSSNSSQGSARINVSSTSARTSTSPRARSRRRSTPADRCCRAPCRACRSTGRSTRRRRRS